MAAMKGKTVTTESLDKYIGKKVKFDDEGTEVVGEVIQVSADGYLEVDTISASYSLKPDEATIIADEEVTPEIVEEEAEEGTEKGVELDDEEDIEIEDEKEKTAIIPTIAIISMKEVNALDLTGLKALVKENKIKVPLRAYSKIELLKEEVFRHFGWLTKKAATIIPVTKPVVVTEKKKVVEKVKKEKIVKEVKEKKSSKDTFLATLFKNGGGTIDELNKKLDEGCPGTSSKDNRVGVITRGNFMVAFGVMEKCDGGYYLKK